jgi:hypothetical protein
MNPIPQVITHNYHPERGPFRNICHLPPPEAESVLDEIRAAGHRRIKADYLERRLAAEEWLIRESRRRLGSVRLERPIYFFLGNFSDGRNPSRPDSFVIPLTGFAPDKLTFTYPDSMASFPLGTRDEHARERKPYHGRVFTLQEIEDVVAEFGMPGNRWATEPSMRHDKFLEVQVWDDRPIERFLHSHRELDEVAHNSPSGQSA